MSRLRREGSNPVAEHRADDGADARALAVSLVLDSGAKLRLDNHAQTLGRPEPDPLAASRHDQTLGF
jgi:hypothetical protein